MSNPWIVISASVLILVASAFFVAVEFATLGAKRHRLEEAATTSRSARAALRSSRELTLLLAGCQLGITGCTLALGAVTKPAVHHWLTPLLETVGAPYWLADAAAFTIALVAMTFLHLVVGEMAPKSWAIAHPERSATLLALPARVLVTTTRPLLSTINTAANGLVRWAGVTPADQVATGQNPEGLRQLVKHSVEAGTLDDRSSEQLSGALDLQRVTVRTVATGPLVTVPASATAAAVREAARESGHRRILVGDGDPRSVVHVRDTLLLADDAPITPVAYRVLDLPPDTPLYTALTRMRETSQHLAVVRTAGDTRVITIADILGRVLPGESTTADAGSV
ncbi:CBS domain containing-hemolysin-like protein [Prauserella isguenensis]|uniref:CBS domain containing-hemolysin-like protein n=1 Tax=Prauserella isguenensis TaxID=1470180 RepID=A0A839S5I7_9PSEU|nr:CNNM domain-containing protein [Prauserella isguenensis]MBB3053361.1 CBS domain containing-hemolysin-like protein [Prauserella isguenensis]